MRTILHVDLNSFFATAQQQTNPRLRGKPVGIIKAHGRTCVIAASVEAKRYGVKTGTDVFEAKKLCPHIIFIPAEFDKYADISMRFIDICSTYSPTCEVFSLDECFVDVTDSEKIFGGVLNIALEIKRRLREEIGDWMTCSVGISHNKVLAKLAGEQIKPDGLYVITPETIYDVLDKSELMDVCGLGWALDRHLRQLGIDSFPKLRKKSLEFLHKHFGPFWSVHLYNIGRGIDNSPVIAIPEIPDAKSVGRTYTTHRNLTSKSEILTLVRNLCEEAACKARQMKLAGRYVAISLQGGSIRNSSEGWWGHRTLKNYIDDGKRFFDLCVEISKDWPFFHQDKPVFAGQSYVRFCGVTLAMLTKKDYLTTPLFPTDRRRMDLIKSVDEVNSRYGHYSVFPGQLLGMPIIMPEVNGYFGDKKFRLNFLHQ